MCYYYIILNVRNPIAKWDFCELMKIRGSPAWVGGGCEENTESPLEYHLFFPQ